MTIQLVDLRQMVFLCTFCCFTSGVAWEKFTSEPWKDDVGLVWADMHAIP